MSPNRIPRVYSSSGSLTKPYARKALPSLLPTSPSGSLPAVDNNSQPSGFTGTAQTPSSPQHLERHGFPTYAQYKKIETGYIKSLTPRRQGKALISQSMFDRIWDVLHYPETQLETAQFRFWARKMFTLNKNYRITLGVAEGQESAPQEVLLHDNLLVAIQEQLYDLLCYCHGSTGHGGRDKTCALIRKHYTWVPKDLVSNFIKACPTCIMKKCGNMDSQIPQLMAEADKIASGAARLISVTGAQDENTVNIPIPRPRRHHRRHRVPVETHEPAGNGSSMIGFSDSAYMKMSASLGSMSTLHDATNQLVATSLPWSIIGNNHLQHHPHPLTLAPLMSSGGEHGYPSGGVSGNDEAPGQAGGGNLHPLSPLGSCHYQPMVREVSLYKGLPNGWQYRHDDFATAHAEFMDSKRQWDGSANSAGGGGPMVDDMQFRNMSTYTQARIPDIAGLWAPGDFAPMVKEEEAEEVGCMSHHQLFHHQYPIPIPPPMVRSLDLSELPPALRNYHNLHHQSLSNTGEQQLSDHVYIPEIDPALMALPEQPHGVVGSHSGSGSSYLPNGDEQVYAEQKRNIFSTGGQVEEPNGQATESAPSQQPGLSTSSTITSLSQRIRTPLHIDIPSQAQHLSHENADVVVAPTNPSNFGEGPPSNRKGDDAQWVATGRKSSSGSPGSASSGASDAQLLSPFSPMGSDGSTPASSAATTPMDEVLNKSELKMVIDEGEGALKRDLAGGMESAPSMMQGVVSPV